MQPLIMRNSFCAVFAAVVVLGLSSGVAAQTVTACDRLAAHPEDPDRVSEGVPTSAVDQALAITACEADHEANPDNARITYQLARVYFYNGRTADAVATMEKAAEGGHRQAQFVMGALISNKRPDTSGDMCDAELWWAQSAKAGRLAAQVSYVRHTTKGLFDDCTRNATVEEMDVFLDNVRETGGGDYYLRLLLTDLKEDLAAYRK